MDVHENGQLRRIASSLGTIVESTVSGEAGEIDARAFHVERKGKPHVVVAASVSSTVVLAMLVEAEHAATAMAAARVLVTFRGDVLRPGKVVSLPAGAPGARSVRGSTGAFAILAASSAELPSTIDRLAVHAQAPISEWEEATLEEVQGQDPDLVSRFKAPKPRGAKASFLAKPPPSAQTKVLRRRRNDD